MKKYFLTYESAFSSHYPLIREFCQKNSIEIKSMGMDSIFKYQMNITILCKSKREANKLQTFIWDEFNGGAFCALDPA